MTLYRKYRPKEFEDMYGNETVLTGLQALLSDEKTRPHVYLLSGPTGCGKTTLSRIMAKELGAKGADHIEVDSADFRGIDTIRAIRKNAQYQPMEGKCRLWVLDECHKLSNDAQNALLKILEDTPPHVYFILCTTEPSKLIKTIQGRCSHFQVQPLNDSQMMKLLRRVVKAEEGELPKIIYEQIIQDSFGHARNALQILEQVLHVDPEDQMEIAQKVAETQSQSIELCRALIQGASWKKVSKILKGLKGQEAESIRRHVIGYCESVMLNSGQTQAGVVMEEFIEPFYNSGWPGLVYACFSVIKGDNIPF